MLSSRKIRPEGGGWSTGDRLIGGPVLSVIRYRCIEDLNRLFTSMNVRRGLRIYLSFPCIVRDFGFAAGRVTMLQADFISCLSSHYIITRCHRDASSIIDYQRSIDIYTDNRSLLLFFYSSSFYSSEIRLVSPPLRSFCET